MSNTGKQTIELFITGTDTDVGKTIVTVGILRNANKQGLASLGFKPIAAGCDETPEGLRNSDAVALMDNASMQCNYELVNPVAYQPPIAPHIAAKQLNQSIDLDLVENCYEQLLAKSPDILITEGAGGWQLPITDNRYFSEWVSKRELNVILVVGIKLGCLNHAVLTAQAIENSSANLVGWIANSLATDIANYDEMVATLNVSLGKPLLGKIPFFDSKIEKTPELHIDLTSILEK